MNEFMCEACGAIYLQYGENMPKAIMCTCKGREFKLLKKIQNFAN